MDDKLHKILNKINLDESYFNLFLNAKINKTHIDDLKNIVSIEIANDSDIPYDLYDLLVELFSKYFDGATINLKIVNNTNRSDNFEKNYRKVLEDCYESLPNIKAVSESIEIIGNSLNVVVVNAREKKDLDNDLRKLRSFLEAYGTNFEDSIVIDDNRRIAIDEKITEESTEIVNRPYVEHKAPTSNGNSFTRRRKKDVDEFTIFGNRIPEDEAVTKISSIVGEISDVVIEAKVFGTEEFVPQSKAFKILTLKVTDYTDSIICKIFVRDDEAYDLLVKKTKTGSWVKLRGNTKFDEYSGNELVLTAYDVYTSNKKDTKLVDDAPVKRVELHAHTMMSQMDGVSKLDLDKHTCEIVSNAIDMGYKAVAITDHSGCQAFPIVFELVTGYNKGVVKKLKGKKEELEGKLAEEENEDQKKLIEEELEGVKKELENPKKFKGLYGTELTLVDDTVNIVVRPQELDLLDTEYVVFDTETTGFNAAGGDQMIEIGAVKIKNGEITDSFDELIDPKRPIPKKITELTNITDEMVKGKDDEETVTKKFLDWAKDAPMVAHNAKFDISFIEMAMKKYSLGEFKNTVIDTLELSRTLDQGYARHSLSALVQRYGVEFDEEGHHRAD